MGRLPKNTPTYEQEETDQGQLYTFDRNLFLVQTHVFRESSTLGAVLEKLMKSEVDEKLPHSQPQYIK